MKHFTLLLFLLALLSTSLDAQIAQRRTTLLTGDTLVPGVPKFASQSIVLPDSVSRHRLIAYTLGGGSPVAVTNNFRVFALVTKDRVTSDTLFLNTLVSTGNASMTFGTKSMTDLTNHWMPTLSGTDSTAVWYLRSTGGFTVQYGVKSFAGHAGNQKVVLVLDIP